MKFNLLKTIFMTVSFLWAGAIMAQSTVTGTVNSEEGALPGVNVVVKGTLNGTATDFDGNYVLEDVPADAVLEFSFVGYATQDVPVNGRTQIDINLLDRKSVV